MSIVVKIADVRKVELAPDGDLVLVKAAVLLDDKPTEFEIAITTDLAPAMAIALLASTATARAKRDGMEPALEVLAVAVVASGDAEKIRLQLLFDKGTVLPVEVPMDAAHSLRDDLVRELPLDDSMRPN